MDKSILYGLATNASLLIVLGFTYIQIIRKWADYKLLNRVLNGLLFGFVAIGVMLVPLNLMPGIVFDTRSIVISVGGLFGGPLVAAISFAISAAFRVWEGGVGTLTGVLVGFSSGIVGTLGFFWRKRYSNKLNLLQLYAFGVFVHIAMLLCMFTLPNEIAWRVLSDISLPVMLIYPVATLLLCLLLLEREERVSKEKLLLESEERHRTILQTALDGIMRVDLQGRIVEVNDAYSKMSGYSIQELLGLSLADLEVSESPAEIEARTQKIIKTGHDRFETRHRRKDGSILELEINSQYKPDDGGHLVAFLRDISERKQVEEKLRRNEKDLKESQRIAKLGSWRLDVQTNEVSWTEELYKMYGFDPNLPPPPYTEHMKLFTPESWELLSTSLARTVETGVPYELELETVRPDGSNGWMWVRGEAISDESGKTIELWGAAQDITEDYLAHKALRESEAMLANMASQVPGMLYQFKMAPDGAFSVPYSSQGVKDIFGCSPEDVCNDFSPIFNAIHPEDRDRILQTIDDSIKHMSQWKCEYRVQIAGEPIKWVFDNSIPEKKADGSVVWSGYNVDITERRQAEEERQKGFDLLNNLASLVPGVIYQYRLYPDGRSAFPYSSPGMYDIYEVTPEEVREDASVVFGRLHPEDHDRVAEAIFESARTLKPFYCELRVILPEKGLGWRWSQAHPERTEDGGTLWHGIILDITERKQAEQALQQSEQRYRRLTENLPDMIYRLSLPDGNYQYVNSAAKTVFGYTPDEFYNNPLLIKEIIHPDWQSYFEEQWQKLQKGQMPPTYEYQIIGPSGDVRWINQRNVAVRDQEGHLVAIEGISTNVTEQKRLEQQLAQAQKMEALGTLTGGIAHDFNNLLAAIMGYAELATDELPKETPIQQDLDAIIAAATKARHLVRQILTFSREVEGHKQPISVSKVGEDANVILDRTIPKMIDLEFKLQQDIWPVSADANQMEQMFINLVANAADAADSSGRIRVDTSNVSLDRQTCQVCGARLAGRHVLISVKDDGAGMSPEVQTRIFEPFFTTKGVGKGTGLGLSTVYGIVNGHGGHICCKSREGEGSEFMIYLPAVDQHTNESVPTHGGDIEEKPGSGTIMVVDDEPTVRDIAKKMLSRGGYQVLQAASGEEALDSYNERKGEIDLVLLDLGMPGMGGKACLEEIRRLDQDAKVLIASGYIQYELTDELEALGAIGMVAKPYRKADILKAVKEALDS